MEERYYDLIFIARPATPEEEIKKILGVVEHTCAEKGGKVEKTEQWGTRKLAYRVAKHREGIYVHQEIRTTHGELIAELDQIFATKPLDEWAEIFAGEPVFFWSPVNTIEDVVADEQFRCLLCVCAQLRGLIRFVHCGRC